MSFVTFLVDDDKGVLSALARLLKTTGYETRSYDSPGDFLAGYDSTLPGCVILDLTMPGVDGLTLQRELAQRQPEPQVIFLTGTGDLARGVQAMKAGAVDFLTKPVDGAMLLNAVARARAKDENARSAQKEKEAANRLIARLTPRERQVLDHVLLGLLNKQIAAALGTVEKTIKVHRGRVMAKMEVRSVAELVRLAERAGIGPARVINPS
jgi:FixJ family two-component response regulator